MSNRLEHKVTQRKDVAEWFLNCLDPNAKAWTFQVYGTMNRTLSGSLNECWDDIVKANNAGNAVAVTVNETDGTGRKIENIKRVRAVWQEDDKGFKGEFPIEPSLVIESSPNRFHRYWFVDELSFDEFEGIQRRLVHGYGSDVGAASLANALRLPGTVNWKHGESWLVDRNKEPVEDGYPRYRREALLKAFPPVEIKSTECFIGKLENADWSGEGSTIKDALKHIPASIEYPVWRSVVWAINHESKGSEEGWDLATRWSETCPEKFDLKALGTVWNDFNPNHPNVPTARTIYAEAYRYGWKGNRPAKAAKEKSHNLVEMPGFPFKPLGPIAHTAHASMREEFKDLNHNPSKDQYMALREIMVCSEAMVKGHWHDGTPIEKKFYLSSIDPGIGKTKSFCHFIAAFLRVKAYKHTGIVICVGRLTEIESLFKYLKKLGVNENQIGVYTAKGNDANQLGNKNYTKARVLLTTQQMIDARVKRGANFCDIPEFQFEGRPRRLRIWDEAILPGRQLTIGVFKIYAMLDVINNHNTELASCLLQVAMGIKDHRIVDIPDFREIYGISENEVRDWFADTKTKIELNEVSTLWQLSGKTVNVVKEMKGETALSYEDTLPDDIKPVLVLDASGRVRHAYEDWANSRKDIVALYPGTEECLKDYSNLTVHWLNKPGGKNSIEEKPGTYAEAVARTINSKPDEKFLVVHHINLKNKKGKEISFKGLVEDLIDGDKERVKYIHWGDHSATNDYVKIPNVIFVAGTAKLTQRAT